MNILIYYFSNNLKAIIILINSMIYVSIWEYDFHWYYIITKFILCKLYKIIIKFSFIFEKANKKNKEWLIILKYFEWEWGEIKKLQICF